MPMLELLIECADDKVTFLKVLMYANMLYLYVEKQAAMELKEEIEPVVRYILERYGYRGLEIGQERGQTKFQSLHCC